MIEVYDRNSQQYSIAGTNTSGARDFYLTPVGPLTPSGAAWDASGDFWDVAGSFGIHRQQYVDFVAGTSTYVPSCVGDRNVASNGDAAWTDGTAGPGGGGGELFSLRAGTVTKLFSDPTWTTVAVAPITDGINLVYTLYSNAAQHIVLHGAAGDVQLGDSYQSSIIPSYRARAGWIAYNSPASGARQIFDYDPSGVSHQLTAFGSDSTVETMDGAGGVMVLNATVKRRYYAAPGVTPVEVAGNEGTSKCIAGQWYLMAGRSLFRLATDGNGGGGSCIDSDVPPGGPVDMATGPANPPADMAVAPPNAMPDMAVAPPDAIPDMAVASPNAMPDMAAGSPVQPTPSPHVGCSLAPPAPLPWSQLWLIAVCLGLLRGRRLVRRSR
jgi:hypothetical protein